MVKKWANNSQSFHSAGYSKRGNLSQADVVLAQLQAQISEFADALKETTSKCKKLRSCLSSVAEKVCDMEYGTGQLGGKNQMLSLSDTQLRDFIIQNCLEQKVKMAQTIQSLQEMYLAERTQKDQVAKQLLDTQNELNNSLVKIQTLTNELNLRPQMKVTDYDENKNRSLNEFKNEHQFGTTLYPDDNQSQKDKRMDYSTSISDTNYENMNIENGSFKQQTEDDRVIVEGNQVFSVNIILNSCDTYQRSLLKLIADSRENEQPKIVDLAKSAAEFGSDTVIRRNLKSMVENHLLEQQSISTPIRKKITLYSLSEIGREVYKELYGNYPPLDEMSQIVQMHATLNHGYCIKDTASVLASLGYTDICIDSTKNAVTVADGRRYVPDITAMFDSNITYWEVELGHHHDADMVDKLSKANRVAKTVYIVVDKKETKVILQRQVNEFRKQMIRQRSDVNLIVYVGTLSELQDKVYLTVPENRMDLRGRQRRKESGFNNESSQDQRRGRSERIPETNEELVPKPRKRPERAVRKMD